METNHIDLNVRIRRPGLGRIGSLPRAVTRRWPALLVATAALAVPMSVALADSFDEPVSIILRNGVQTPALSISQSAQAYAIEVTNELHPPASPGGNGMRVIAGQDGIDISATIGHALFAQSSQGTGIQAQSGKPSGAVSLGGSGVGVEADGEKVGLEAGGGDVGVVSRGINGAGVLATSDLSAGVDAFSGVGPGVKGASNSSSGVVGTSKNGSGVVGSGSGQFGIGVVGNGTFAGVQASGGTDGVAADGKEYGVEASGGKAGLRLFPAATAGPPTSGLHRVGEFYVDSAGQLFLCTQQGTPGTWRHVHLD